MGAVVVEALAVVNGGVLDGPELPGVQALERVEEVSASNGFRFGLTMRFASQADYDAYNTHPLHQTFVQEVWIPNVTSFQEIDYLAP